MITFKNSKAKLLTAEIIDTTPKDLDLILRSTENDIEFKPTLLNSGDSFSIKLLVDNFIMDVILSGRIIGVNRIKEVKKRQLFYFRIVFYFCMGLIMGVLAIIGIYSFHLI